MPNVIGTNKSERDFKIKESNKIKNFNSDMKQNVYLFADLGF